MLAGLLLPAGAIGDRLGRRTVLLAGLAIFGGGALVATQLSDPGTLIAVRAVMGLGAAMIKPTTLSIITGTFSADARHRAVGIWAGVAGGSALVGLLASGLLLTWFHWSSVFGLDAALAAVGGAMTLRFVARDRREFVLRPVQGRLAAGMHGRPARRDWYVLALRGHGAHSAPSHWGRLSCGFVRMTRENVEAVCRLRVAERQERLVAPAAQTVAEAKCYGPAAVLRAITFEGRPVGVVWVQTDEPVPYLVRFMVDVEWQGRGIGRRAVALVLDELRAMGLEAVELSYVPVAQGAERFWLACGFEPTGQMHGEEALARVDLR